MLVKAKVRYAFRVLLYLGLNVKKGPLSLKKIAESQGFSEKYVAHIMDKLVEEGFVKAVRGVHGGYALNKDPSKINLVNIMEAVGEKFGILECIKDPSICKNSQVCAARYYWEGLSMLVEELYAKQTLAKIIANRRTLNPNYQMVQCAFDNKRQKSLAKKLMAQAIAEGAPFCGDPQPPMPDYVF